MVYIGGKDQAQVKLKVTHNHTNPFFISLYHSPIEIGLYGRTVLKRENLLSHRGKFGLQVECSLTIAITLKDNQAWPK